MADTKVSSNDLALICIGITGLSLLGGYLLSTEYQNHLYLSMITIDKKQILLYSDITQKQGKQNHETRKK